MGGVLFFGDDLLGGVFALFLAAAPLAGDLDLLRRAGRSRDSSSLDELVLLLWARPRAGGASTTGRGLTASSSGERLRCRARGVGS